MIFGAMQNPLIAQGDYYRLLTSMFLHIGLIHLAFNSYALYILGQDVERLYRLSPLSGYLFPERPGAAAWPPSSWVTRAFRPAPAVRSLGWLAQRLSISTCTVAHSASGARLSCAAC